MEKKELEMFWRGELAIEEEDEVKEDASAVAAPPKQDPAPSTPAVIPSATSATAAASSASAAASNPASNPAGHVTYQGSTLNVHPYLSSMVIYTQPMKFQVKTIFTIWQP